MTAESPDPAAALVEERAFLLRSLEDLEAEHAAGDLPDDEYETLADSYVARTAQVERQLAHAADGQPLAAAAAAPRVSARRRVLTMAAAIGFAALAGVVLAQAVGYRSPSGELSGGIRQSTGGLLNEADALSREGRWEEAIETYDEVLSEDPSNAEALTYGGWIRFTQFGEAAEGSDQIAEAIAVDPTYPDARVFGALTARSNRDWQAAAEHLGVLDGLADVPPQVQQLVDGADLRGQVVGGLLVQSYSDAGTVDLDPLLEPQGSFTLEEIARGALRLDAEGEFVAALVSFEAVLSEDPDNRTALIGMGRRLAATPDVGAQSPETAARGRSLLDRAVDLNPDDVEARTFRALALALDGQDEPALADLAVIDSLPVPEALVEVVEALRGALS